MEELNSGEDLSVDEGVCMSRLMGTAAKTSF
jgi:hypothetical protein